MSMKSNIFIISTLIVTLFISGVSTEAFAKKMTKAEKKEAKKLKKQAKQLIKKDPFAFKKMTEESKSLRGEVSSLNARIAELEKELQEKDVQLAESKKIIEQQSARLAESQNEGKSKYLKGLVFRVQIGAFRNKDLTKYFDNNSNFNGEVDADGLKKYTLCYFRDYWEADKFKKYIREMGVKDAWIVPYRDGVRIEMKDALQGQPVPKTTSAESTF